MSKTPENRNEAPGSRRSRSRLVRVLQRWVVAALENSCCLLHWVPRYTCQLSRWSGNLDLKWDTGYWEEVAPPAEPDAPATKYCEGSNPGEYCLAFSRNWSQIDRGLRMAAMNGTATHAESPKYCPWCGGLLAVRPGYLQNEQASEKATK